ncbi:MAG TPA: hypothetical protein VEJ38_02610 [Candidatus Acidoferrales bacterium]|nr:hypothetical protein [Candidatus Acidoferrales bacterium]
MEPEVPAPSRHKSSSFPAAFAIGVVITLLVAGGFVWLTRVMQTRGPAPIGKLPFGPNEQTYAQQIHFQPGEMSQATNFLNQEFTYVAGTVTNAGPRTLRALDVVIEFRDAFNQVVLRDPQRIILTDEQPLKAGGSRDFSVTLGAHLPTEWNRQYPAIRVTGLVVE